MPRGDKSSYTLKQKRKDRDIETGYKRGSGRGKRGTKVSARKGGRLGGKASARRPAAARKAAARKAVTTRRKRATR